MKNFVVPTALFAQLLVFTIGSAACAAESWTDPEKARAEHPDFEAQGEYVREGAGLQVVALDKGIFYLSRFEGGLPGAGWSGSAPATQSVERAALAAALEGFEKTERTSPTIGAEPPAGATVLFVGEDTGKIKGEVRDGYVWAGSETVDAFGSFSLHLEFRLPFKPSAAPSSQDRGNSGVYIHNRYEVQVLDSFGLVFDREQVGLPLRSDPDQWCACLYKFKAADVPVCFPPLAWQTFDIDFAAAQFDGARKVADARVTVKHNGVTVHDDVALPSGTGAGASREDVPAGPIIFQGHGNPVAFRNLWIVGK